MPKTCTQFTIPSSLLQTNNTTLQNNPHPTTTPPLLSISTYIPTISRIQLLASATDTSPNHRINSSKYAPDHLGTPRAGPHARDSRTRGPRPVSVSPGGPLIILSDDKPISAAGSVSLSCRSRARPPCSPKFRRATR